MQNTPGGILSIRMSSFRYRDSHYKDKAVLWPVLWPSCLYNAKYPWLERLSLYWDVAPFALQYNYSVKLEKGEYVLRLQVRHEKTELLERLKDMPVLIHHKLASNVTLDTYASHAQALVSGKKFGSQNLQRGTVCPIFVAPLADDK